MMTCMNTHVPHILELTNTDKRRFFDSFDFIFFDCDGVIWMLVDTIPHSDEAINSLKDAGKKCKFISNNSHRSNEEYLEKFERIGVRDVLIEDVIHPAKSIIRYVKTHLPADAKFFSICDKLANELFRKNGLNVKTLEVPDSLTPVKFIEMANTCGEKVDAVLCDLNVNFHYLQLARAVSYLQQNEECELIAGCCDPVLVLPPDSFFIGFGCILDLLAQQTKKEPIRLGKPGKALGEQIKEEFNIDDPKRVLFVGDGLKADIGFGKLCGFQTMLVLSGVTTKKDMLTAPSEYCPDFYADGISDFIVLLKDLKNIK